MYCFSLAADECLQSVVRPLSRGIVMETRIDEIGAGVYRLSVFVADAAPPAGFTYNHFLFAGDEPLLFHCGSGKCSH